MAVVDITSANATILIRADQIIPTDVELEGFSTDTALQSDATVVVEARMGVDGKMAAGYKSVPTNITINLEANNKSEQVLKDLLQAQIRDQTKYDVTITVKIPASRVTATYTDGVLTEGITINNLGQLLEKSVWKFVFGTVLVQQN